MNHVDLVSRFGELTLRLTPVLDAHDPSDSARPTWEARLFNQGMDATTVAPEDPDEPQTLYGFFNEIYAERLGWDGRKAWSSRFGRFTIEADHDQINSVRLYCQMSGGIAPQWVVNFEVHLDPGRFHRVGANLELFNDRLHGEDEVAPAG